MYYLGIEIGGTKLQLGVGAGDGVLVGLVARQRSFPPTVPTAFAGRSSKPCLLPWNEPALRATNSAASASVSAGRWTTPTRPSSSPTRSTAGINFPLAKWIADVVGLPAVLGNDADVAGLAEALHGAGKGLSPIFYVTIGSGIGGGLILDGSIYRGLGRGAAEFGHLRIGHQGDYVTLESIASGWGMEGRAAAAAAVDSPANRRAGSSGPDSHGDPEHSAGRPGRGGLPRHRAALSAPHRDWRRRVVARRILPFRAAARRVAERVFRPFAGLTDIVPAALGEEVVVPGALARHGRNWAPQTRERNHEHGGNRAYDHRNLVHIHRGYARKPSLAMAGKCPGQFLLPPPFARELFVS